MKEIKVEKSTKLKIKPSENDNLRFGNYFTDHMFLMDYEDGYGWSRPRIVPYSPILVDPSSKCLHYGQTSFEDIRAFRSNDGNVLLFRPQLSIKKLNLSNIKSCIPEIDEYLCLEAIEKLVLLEKDWIPNKLGASLHIRPFIFATEPSLDVSSSSLFTFAIICSPVSSTYRQPLIPTKVLVENKISRSVKGGIGATKTAGNYISTIIAKKNALSKGCSDIIWLDSIEKRYIEELGNMNIFFVLYDEIVTPQIDENISQGIIRTSVIELLESWGYKVSERKITLGEIEYAYSEGNLKEAFASGVCDTIISIGTIKTENRDMILNEGQVGKISRRLNNNITAIQCGDIRDMMNWTKRI